MTRRFRWLARRLIRQDQTGAQAFCLSGIILSIRASLRSDYAPARGRPGPGRAGVPAPLAPRSEAGVWTSEGRGWLRRAPSTPAVTSMPATATAREKSRRERARPPVPGKPSLAGPRVIEARRQGPDAGSAPGDPAGRAERPAAEERRRFRPRRRARLGSVCWKPSQAGRGFAFARIGPATSPRRPACPTAGRIRAPAGRRNAEGGRSAGSARPDHAGKARSDAARRARPKLTTPRWLPSACWLQRSNRPGNHKHPSIPCLAPKKSPSIDVIIVRVLL